MSHFGFKGRNGLQGVFDVKDDLELFEDGRDTLPKDSSHLKIP